MSVNKSLAKDVAAFLTTSGAEMLDPTNPWEIARFKAKGATHVIYQNGKGKVTFSDVIAHEAFTAYQEKRQWTAVDIKERVKRKTVEELLIERDGENCFYCNVLFDTEVKPTLEHLLSIKHGGNNHLSNLVLACKPCNELAGHLHVIEKVVMREKARQS